MVLVEGIVGKTGLRGDDDDAVWLARTRAISSCSRGAWGADLCDVLVRSRGCMLHLPSGCADQRNARRLQ